MAEENKKQPQPQEVPLSELLKIRRDKLKELQEAGQDPFQQTKFDWNATAQEIKDNFDAMEGKPVKVAGRLMSKRGMGKVSFCDLQDRSGRIQLYARQDEMDEALYKRFKKYDIGDIVGVDGEVFRTQRGEMSVRAKNSPARKLRQVQKFLNVDQDKIGALGDVVLEADPIQPLQEIIPLFRVGLQKPVIVGLWE